MKFIANKLSYHGTIQRSQSGDWNEPEEKLFLSVPLHIIEESIPPYQNWDIKLSVNTETSPPTHHLPRRKHNHCKFTATKWPERPITLCHSPFEHNSSNPSPKLKYLKQQQRTRMNSTRIEENLTTMAAVDSGFNRTKPDWNLESSDRSWIFFFKNSTNGNRSGRCHDREQSKPNIHEEPTNRSLMKQLWSLECSAGKDPTMYQNQRILWFITGLFSKIVTSIVTNIFFVLGSKHL